MSASRKRAVKQWVNSGKGRPLADSPFMPSMAPKTTLPGDNRTVRQYQRAHGLPETGVMDAPTQRQMRRTNTRPGHPNGPMYRITEDDPRWNPRTMGNRRGR